MTFLVYCGDKTCAFNNKGKCRNFKVALSEQGVCMGYSPLIMPNVRVGSGIVSDELVDDSQSDNPIGFKV